MDVLQLIRGVRSRKPLWDRKHTYYHDRMITMGLWNEVAISLGTDPDTARIKWKGLRDTFRGELRKVNKTMASGTPCKSTNWEYFEEMLFVKEQIYSNRRNLAEILGRGQGEDCGGGLEAAELCKAEVADEEAEGQGGSSGAEELRTSPMSEPASAHVLSNVQQDDDDFNFLMSILPQLRRLPTTKNLYVRLKMQELLYNEIVKQDTS